MLLVYGYYTYFNSYIAEIDFRRHNLTSIETSLESKGSCQVKQNPKIREEIGIGQTPPTDPPIHFFLIFGDIWKHENNIKNSK